MSRSNIHRQLKKLTNQSITQFIRKVRLEKAMQLLLETDDSASEIAYKVGFGSPAYFTHCFHEYFGFPPGEVKKRHLTANETSIEPAPAVDNLKKISFVRGRRKKIIIQLMAVIFFLFLLLILFDFWVKENYLPNSFLQNKQDLSVVVLPFKNFSSDHQNQYLADGLMEDILNNLFRMSALRVVSRTTADKFRNSNLSVGEIAQALNVNYVLEGSIRKYDSKIRISVQLIDARNDQHVWSSSFDRTLSNILGVQSDIALQVAHELNAVISDSEIKQIEKISTKNPEAYENYLRARFLLHKANSTQRADFEKTGVLNCISYYEKAIAADTSFAEAYSGLANAWFNLSAWGFLPAREGFPKARAYSTKAIECDPNCAEAHAVLGAYCIWGGPRKIADGGTALKKAVELNPNFSTARQWYAQYLMITGPIEEARLHINRALELEPYFWVVQNLNAWIYYFEKKYEKSIEAAKIARDLNQDFSSNNWLFVLNYARLNEGENMLQELQSILKKYTQDENYLNEVQGAFEKNEISGIFYWLDETNRNKPVPVEGIDGHPFYSAWWNAILGNKEEALHWLEQTVEHPRPLGHYSNLITTNPDFDLLRNDYRFHLILDKSGLASYNNMKMD